MENYYFTSHEITPVTMAILSLRDVNGDAVTRVIEEDAEYVVDHSPTKIIDNACRFFGSSLKGRQDGTRDISGITHKAPISIDPSSGMYFFPTTSPSNRRCSWIAHSYIDKIRKAADRHTEIQFTNGRKIIIATSYGSIMNQLQRTAQFRYLLDHRIRLFQQYQTGAVGDPSQ
ncbi:MULTISPECIES: competence protein ComK [Oceanobacillus]|uniref:Competence protein n=1 Tax=Oceanobacillus profundus TaxID=372463 RepID=A0A417YM71_9BACI|nr:competence protein ComK [Oceanobacillus profundus]MBR3119127.1 competence protein ComK [Oceanobacillus sp.]MCM3399253.1 competence protein ComK [Oceanobacillus profundus]PAE29510.1 competence protein [Paenibacillus sp. 7884-2]RHW34405.1 competence protein [Oceanobacillus profundus]